jgi:hypothetical protein
LKIDSISDIVAIDEVPSLDEHNQETWNVQVSLIDWILIPFEKLLQYQFQRFWLFTAFFLNEGLPLDWFQLCERISERTERCYTKGEVIL